jgi:RNA polymerase sigma-70 factor, ECF subfamily
MSPSQDDSLRSLLIEAVELARAGDSEAFRPLFERYKNEIYGYIVGLTSNAEVAHDLSQETFLKAWEKLPTLHDASKFKPWLYAIARNLVHDWRRRQKIFWESWEQIGEQDFFVYESYPEDELAEVQLVRRALAKVPMRYRNCLLLQEVGGFSRDEIAELLGMSKASVSTYQSVARKRFRQAFFHLAHQQSATRKRR